MANFDNGNVNLYYEFYEGSGPLVVLINGHTRSCSDFKQFIRYLGERSYTVLTFDNRGAGKTRFEGDFTLEDLADDSKSLMDHLSLSSAHLVGFSMGGVVARVFSHKYPEALQTLSLVSTMSTRDSFKGEGKPWGDSVEEILHKLEDYVAASFFQKNKVLMEAMAKGILSQLRKGFKESSTAQRRASAETQAKFFSIAPINAPVLLLHGEEDKVIPFEDSLVLQSQNPKAQVVQIKGGGHLLLMEKSRELFEEIESFISEQD